jgi:2,4-dienoyl-CoA reductase-like NADH-dependent reductase (Old Yellow Enzyme family)
MRLFSELTLRDLTLRNRIVVSPMCEYSSTDGFANDWHLVHLGSRAVGGAGIVFTEATAIPPEGRISPQDLGIWKDDHIEMLARITRFIREQGAVSGIQLAHAGRKGSTCRPGESPVGEIPTSEGGWITVAPSAIPFAPNYPMPQSLDEQGIRKVVDDFVAAAKRALAARFMIVEIHAAHGYLVHEFLSPLSNHRTDAYGGSFENRTRILREVITAVRRVWPEKYPLFVRISASDWVEGGWDIDQSIELAKQIAPLGVDLVDCSSAGNTATVQIPLTPGYQVPFAEAVRKGAGIPTGAVGLITSGEQAEAILAEGKADVVDLAREFLRDPYFPLHVAARAGETASWPIQYLRAAPPGSPARTPFGS